MDFTKIIRLNEGIRFVLIAANIICFQDEILNIISEDSVFLIFGANI